MIERSETFVERLEAYRSYLRIVARLQLSPAYQRKLDASDVVQETLLRAVANRDQFRGTTPEEEAAWLRTILARQLAEELRKLHTHKRDIGLEVSLERELGASSARLEAWLCGDDSTPSQRAQRHEELLHLAAGLMRLPEDLRDAVELHHLHGLTVSDVAEQMGRSRAGVAGLLRRGLAELRAFLDEDVACPTPTRGTTKNNDSMT